MAYLESVERKGNLYYYITRNFRINGKKWKKIRKYVGDKSPSKEQTKKLVREIEKEALIK